MVFNKLQISFGFVDTRAMIVLDEKGLDQYVEEWRDCRA